MTMATRKKGNGLKPLLKIKKMQAKRRRATEEMLYWDRVKADLFGLAVNHLV